MVSRLTPRVKPQIIATSLTDLFFGKYSHWDWVFDLDVTEQRGTGTYRIRRKLAHVTEQEIHTQRIDAKGQPILYGSPDLEVCIHECRVSTEDDVFVATLYPTKTLRLLDLSVLLKEDNGVTEFESLDLTVHMLFLAGRHSYLVTRAIAKAARTAGFNGLIYPSYFSLLRLGQMPFPTVYGISHRRIEQFYEHEQAKTIPNLALFGRPVAAGSVAIKCIDRLVISKVAYEYHFGPTGA